MPTLEDSKRALRKLKEAGMRKLNFAGGEPFLYPEQLGKLLEFAKQDLCLESVSIVSNGSAIKKRFLERHKDNLDILAISCDSFNEETNIKIGRGKGRHVEQLRQVAGWCCEFNIKFKLNTVVNRYNWQEDMNSEISLLRPFRWKCFQVLILENENSGENTLRDAQEFVISDKEFESFIDRHRSQKCIVPESNKLMKDSYLILDEHLCFLNCTTNKKTPSQSLLEVDVQVALDQAGWDQTAFHGRSGVYEWSKSPVQGCGGTSKLDW
ncbi:11452_t:CDS:1 [Ambispora leptoticha]|uniref:11452_t:CDS:1 n=1 Tax=Ambispora leptoticha TaxID=144679 RepID=A0A9N8YSE8_9GLOM|nr:11452_t:CDS:1 [Ambispora leptoticha]